MLTADQRKARLAHRIQKKWWALVAHGDKDAAVLGYVVDALFEDDPIEAVRLCQKGGVPQNIVNEIREVFKV